MLASVAAMQGRIAMWHALGDAVEPIRLGTSSRHVFTSPEIATVGIRRTTSTPGRVSAGGHAAARDQRARQDAGFTDGFVKVFAQPGSRHACSAASSSHRRRPS